MSEVKLQLLDEFSDWVKSHKDTNLKGKITARLNQVQSGNFGDHHAIGDGVSELRINYGPGYRLYYTVRGRIIVILLCGGDKSSQKRDVKKAKELNKEV
jgi:putative addiction module killer protein